MRSVRVSCQTMALYQGRPVFGFQTTVVSRWLVTPIAARSAAVSRPACQRAGDRLVRARGDLQRIVLDPARPRQNLIVFDLMPGDLLPSSIEHHEPRARRALIERADVLSHVASSCQPSAASFQRPATSRIPRKSEADAFSVRNQSESRVPRRPRRRRAARRRESTHTPSPTSPLPGIGRMACARRGPRSRAGLIA